VLAEVAPEPAVVPPASVPLGSADPDEPPGAVEPPEAFDPPGAVEPPDVVEAGGAVVAGAAVADVPVGLPGLPVPVQVAASATPPPAAMIAIDAAATAALRPSFVTRTSCVS
jgi:hypothetical protein